MDATRLHICLMPCQLMPTTQIASGMRIHEAALEMRSLARSQCVRSRNLLECSGVALGFHVIQRPRTHEVKSNHCQRDFFIIRIQTPNQNLPPAHFPLIVEGPGGQG